VAISLLVHPLDSTQEPFMLSSTSRRLTPAALARTAAAALLLSAAAALPSSAQVTQSARSAAAPAVHYVVLWRTEFLARPDTAAPVLAWLDSGQVVRPDGAEHYQTGHARIIVNGRRGWVDNGYIKRVLTKRETDTLRTVVPRRAAPPPRTGDPRQPDRVLPTRKP
jgi:hypothetical protein